jgi:HlyD family secretion protein
MRKIPQFFRTGIRETLRNLDLALTKDQLYYEGKLKKYNDLLAPADPTDVVLAQANLEKARAQLADAQRQWERVKDGPTSAEIALAEAQLADAQRNWERLKDGPDPADLAAAQARVDAVQAALNQVHLTAPFAGTVTLVDVQPGDQVAPGSPAFRLDDLSRLLVDVQVSEVDINQVQSGQPVVLTFDSILAQEYHGQVVEVASVGQTDQGVVNFTVTVELTDADQRVKPGMTAAVTVVVSELEDVLLVPNRAVRSLEGKRVVYVLEDGRSVPVEISLGKSSDTHSEVLSGDLQPGDEIILNPPVQFGPGGPGGGGPFGGD